MDILCLEKNGYGANACFKIAVFMDSYVCTTIFGPANYAVLYLKCLVRILYIDPLFQRFYHLKKLVSSKRNSTVTRLGKCSLLKVSQSTLQFCFMRPSGHL